MKKSVSLLLALSILASAFSPIFAQKSARGPKAAPLAKEAGNRFDAAAAYSDGRGAFVRWQMAVETDNVGFNLYRIGENGQNLANDGIIIGSKARFGSDAAYGDAYSYYDPVGRIGDVYVVESIDASGRRVTSEKVAVTFANDLKAISGRSIEQLSGITEKRKTSYTTVEPVPQKELATEIQSTQFAPDPATQKIIAAKGGAKFGIRTDGLYRVTRNEMIAAGFNTLADPTVWQLYCDGVEQAINVEPNGDYIEFVGKAKETIESDQRYYYLVVGDTYGKRMSTHVARPIGSSTFSVNYQQSSYSKQRINYVNDILNGDADNYWGNVIFNSPTIFTFNLTGVDPTGPDASMTVSFQGFSGTPHSVAVTLNGTTIAPAVGSNTLPFLTSVTVPAALLNEGVNTLSMTSASGNDYSLFDAVSVNYARKFQADQNQTAFYTINYRGARVTGFTTPNIRVFDTTTEGDPVLQTNLSVGPNGAVYDVILPPNRGRAMFAVEDSAIKTVASATQNNSSNLSVPGHNATFLIITHNSFYQQAQAWASYRQRQRIATEIVDVADIFDEFNFGQPSADSINAFLQYAYSNWQTPPQYVLILGDASYDPKNYNGFGYLNLVPTKIVDTVYEETGSDDALADFNGDGLADISIGRIPAQTGDVITNALAKVQGFEQPAMQDLYRGAIFAYDLPSGYDFGAMSAQLRSNLPADVPAFMIGRGDVNSATTLLNEINNGRYVVNYAGHGSVGIWASTTFFGYNTVPSLTNANNQSIFTMLTCLNGYFIMPNADSLAEYLIKAQNGGSVVSWASTGKTTPDIQLLMGNRFFSQLAAGNITRMGDLVRDAKSVIPGGRDVRMSWALIGDPMLKVR